MERGEKAAKLLNDPMMVDAFKAVRGAIVDRWAEAPLRDKEGAHELKLMLKLLTDVQSYLERAVNEGRFAAAEIEQKNRFRRAIGF